MNYLPAHATISIISIVVSGNFDGLNVNSLVLESYHWVEVVVIIIAIIEDFIKVSHF